MACRASSRWSRRGSGGLWILRDPEQQAWHDRIAGTYVVKVPREWPIVEWLFAQSRYCKQRSPPQGSQNIHNGEAASLV